MNKIELEYKLRNQIRSILRESVSENREIALGHEEIDALEKTLKPDEYVWLDDRTGNLTGEKVTKKEYLKRMLRRAVDDKKWDKVQSAILFLDTQI
ncbi:MAG: hypothetical protein LW701_01845 [Fluviicola sp.]|jgi:hypothetical protein|nr:hypothetical protein [Fluviicola sp.]